MIVMEPDMLGTSAMRVTLRDLTKLGIPTKAMWIVVNARQGKSGIAARELEKLFSIPVAAEIPSQRDRRAYDKAIDALARKAFEAPPEAPFTNLTRALSASSASSEANTQEPSEEKEAFTAPADDAALARKAYAERRLKLRQEINEAMVSRVDLVAASRGHSDGEKMTKLRDTIDAIIVELLEGRNDVGDLTLAERAQIKQEIIDEQLGLGPLEDLDARPSRLRNHGQRRQTHLRRARRQTDAFDRARSTTIATFAS